MTHSAIAIYTGKPTETILEDGGSQAWVLDRKNALKAEYGVLCFNPNAECQESASPYLISLGLLLACYWIAEAAPFALALLQGGPQWQGLAPAL